MIEVLSKRGAVTSVAAFLLGGAPSLAAVINTDAVVSTTVQELINGAPGSVTTDDDALNGNLSNTPLTASGSLMSTDLEGKLLATGVGLSEFSDPTRLDQPNPEEFAVELSCFSNAEDVAYVVDGTAEEFRTVVFTTPGNPMAPPEIEFGITATRSVESRVFLSGAIIFWSTEPERDLTDVRSEFKVTVARDDNGATLFATDLTVAGGPAGQAEPVATGPIRFETVTLDDLREAGMDEESIAVLERVERDGTLVIVTVPPQEHPYTYMVRANQPLVLDAVLTARVRNVPQGTGVAAAFGRPFENLTKFIQSALPGVNGEILQRSINAVTAARAMGLVEPTEGASRRRASLACGAFGVEVAALLGLMTLMWIPIRLRR